MTFPVFRKPIVIACMLPGDYYYLHVHKPGEKTWDEMTNKDVSLRAELVETQIKMLYNISIHEFSLKISI